MINASKIVLTVLILGGIFWGLITPAHAQVSDPVVYVAGSDYDSVQIVGSLLDNKIGQDGFNVSYSKPAGQYVKIYIEPIESGWGHSGKSWGVSSSVLYDITRVFKTDSFYVPNTGYHSSSGQNAHFIILSYKIERPDGTVVTYFSGGVANDEYSNSSFRISSYYTNSYNYSSFGPDYWSRYIAAEQVLINLKAEICQIAMSTPPVTEVPGPGSTTPTPVVTSSYTPSEALAPRPEINLVDGANAISFDSLMDGDIINISADISAINFRPGAGAIIVTSLDNEVSYLNTQLYDKNWNLPETSFEIKKINSGQFGIVINERRYESRSIKTIYLNFK